MDSAAGSTTEVPESCVGKNPANAPNPQQSQRSLVKSIFELIQNHYKATKYPKTEAQLLREKWLIPKLVLFNRWHCVPAGILVQFCVGSVYAWSIFNKPIDTLLYGYNAGAAPVTFYIAIGLLGLSAAVMGPWLERSGPRLASLLGSTLFMIGNLLTALALYLKIIWLVYIGYGVIGGFGIGLCYISPVSALQKWFPDRRGLASGFAVCGFGAGSILLSKVQLPLIQSLGLPQTFVVMGLSYFVVMATSALVLRTPPPDFVVNGMTTEQVQVKVEAEPAVDLDNVTELVPPNPSRPPPPSLIEAITSLQFRLMWFMFFANILFGLIIISRLSNLVTDIFQKSPAEASTIVSINAGFNVGGRFLFSTLSDYLGRKNTYCLMLTTQLIVISTFSWTTSNQAYVGFLVTMFMVSACYGGGFSVIPAFLTDLFGPYNIGACHGILLTAWSVAGVGGGLAFTAIFDAIVKSREGGAGGQDAFPYYVNVWWIFGLVFCGWSLLYFIRPTPKDEHVLSRGRSLIRICFCRAWWKRGSFSTG